VFRQDFEPPDLLKLSFETEAEFVAYERGLNSAAGRLDPNGINNFDWVLVDTLEEAQEYLDDTEDDD
jgi:hypothetical protein